MVIEAGLTQRLIVAALLTLFWGPPRDCGAQPWLIGHTSVTLTDPDRDDRPILTEIYYPADQTGEDVPIADFAEGFPIVVFGHGYLMVWSAYENIWSMLVPGGFVVALPRTESGFLPDHLDFGLDLAFVVNQLRAAHTTPDSPFFDALDSAAVVMGHSMGGGAAVLAAASDPSLDAVANLAAAETSPSAIAAAGGVTAPGLVISGSFDGVAPPAEHQEPIFDALSSPCKSFVSITGASHCQFAQPNAACEAGEIWAPDPLINRDTQHALTEMFLLPWLQFHLRGEEAAWYEFENSLWTCSMITYDHQCEGIPCAPPVVVSIDYLEEDVTIRWSPTPFASSYRVYVAPYPHEPFNQWIPAGITADTIWAGNGDDSQGYYRVTADKCPLPRHVP